MKTLTLTALILVSGFAFGDEYSGFQDRVSEQRSAVNDQLTSYRTGHPAVDVPVDQSSFVTVYPQDAARPNSYRTGHASGYVPADQSSFVTVYPTGEDRPLPTN